MARPPARRAVAPLAASLAQIEHRLEVLGGYLVAYLNLDKVIKIIRTEDEPKPVLMKTFKLSEVQADAILNMRLRNLRKLEEMEIRQEDKHLRAEQQVIDAAARAPKSSNGRGSPRKSGRSATSSAPRPRSASAAPALRKRPSTTMAAIEEALVEREPITIVVSEKGWIRALRGTVTDLDAIAFKTDDRLKFAFAAETTSKCLVLATNGRFYTLDAAKLPGGRGHGEPVRLFIDLEQEGDLVTVFPSGRPQVPGRQHAGAGLRRGRGRVSRQYPQGQAGAQRQGAGRSAARWRWSRANWSPRSARTARCWCFRSSRCPEMARGRGVRLQRYKDGGLSDLKTFKATKGLTWVDSAGRSFTLALKELADWRGNRADAGRLAPKGFPRNNKFGALPTNGKAARGNSGRCWRNQEIAARGTGPRRRNAGFSPPRAANLPAPGALAAGSAPCSPSCGSPAPNSRGTHRAVPCAAPGRYDRGS